ncbi:MAG: CotH kinase family protein [Defluviitaleaceae bacterium]|nr:CotH kinase family protein [Defluviitaleaceae bacterium]MCL2262478.1 CotH kinase family protein [Defluviitaleaceae bacterium]
MKFTISFIICVMFFYAGHTTVFADIGGNFPTIHINTEFAANPFHDRNTWRNATISYGNPTTGETLMPTTARVRGRGNSTWWMGADKRPLRFRFDEARSMFGSEHEARDWILLANRFDRSLLRNYSAFYLAEQMGNMAFVPMFQNVHLHVNGVYMGVYLLTDERDTSPGRLQISHHENPAQSGFFFELDNRAPESGTENEDFVVANHLPYAIRYPSGNRLTPAHVTYLREYIEATSRAIRFGTFDEILQLIDLPSFIDFYLVQEFFKDMDAYKYSVFMHIAGEGDERRLFMGPVWDFDIAAGNSDIKWLGTDPKGLYVAIFNYWYRNLMARPEFHAAVAARWQELSETAIPQTIARIRSTATHYRYEFERDFARHPRAVPFLRPEFIANNDFMWHAEYLATWLEDRASWLNAYFAGELPNYCHMWELVEYYTYESHVGLILNGEPQDLEIPIIRLPYATKIALSEATRLFHLETSRNANTLTIRQEGITITHRIGENHFLVTGSDTIVSPVPSIPIQNLIFVPLRPLAEALGYTVDWINETPTVVLDMY